MRSLAGAVPARRSPRMGKKDKKKAHLPPSSVPVAPSAISKRGWKVIGSGILTVFVGFVVLAFTDPQGQNLASQVSPFLIIIGYATIGVGIVLKGPS